MKNEICDNDIWKMIFERPAASSYYSIPAAIASASSFSGNESRQALSSSATVRSIATSPLVLMMRLAPPVWPKTEKGTS